METKGIDLTKCNNCRFRAEISNTEPVSGRIVVDKSKVYLMDENGNYIGLLSLDSEELMCFNGCGFTDFEIVPRDPETYRDWQVGDTIEYSDNYSTGRIIFRGGDFVAADIEGTCNCYTCDELFNEGYRLVLTDIETRIIEEKNEYKPQDGDIVAWQTKESQVGWAISIYEKKKNSYMTLFTTGICGVNEYPLSMEVIRPATEEERQKLFDAMAKGGKRWNAEKKVVEDIPKPYEFRKGEPVLARDVESEEWTIFTFLSFHEALAFNRYSVYDGKKIYMKQCCIPYNERTMNLLGTSDDYKEER